MSEGAWVDAGERGKWGGLPHNPPHDLGSPASRHPSLLTALLEPSLFLRSAPDSRLQRPQPLSHPTLTDSFQPSDQRLLQPQKPLIGHPHRATSVRYRDVVLALSGTISEWLNPVASRDKAPSQLPQGSRASIVSSQLPTDSSPRQGAPGQMLEGNY